MQSIEIAMLATKHFSHDLCKKLNLDDMSCIAEFARGVEAEVLADLKRKVDVTAVKLPPGSSDYLEGFKAGVVQTLDDVIATIEKEMK